MKLLLSTLLLLGALAMVPVSALAQYASPTRDVENPARSAFWANGSVTLSSGFVGSFGTPLATVPDGFRLVIEHVSVGCSSPSGNGIVQALIGVTERVSSSSTVGRSFQIPIAYQGTDASAGLLYVGSLTTRLYSDRGLSGGGVTISATRSNGTGTSTCSFAISGHTVALP